MGYFFVEFHEKTIDMRARYWVLATLVDWERVELALANQVRQMRKPLRPVMGLRFLPMNLRHSVMNRIPLSQRDIDRLRDEFVALELAMRPGDDGSFLDSVRLRPAVRTGGSPPGRAQ